MAAVVLFFMPWLSIECSGRQMATQTGVEMITGKATPTQDAMRDHVHIEGRDESLGHSYLAGIALVAAGIGAVVAFMALGTGRKDLTRFSSGLCSCAFACLLVQAAVGFPAKRELLKGMAASLGAPQSGIPLDEPGRALAQEIAGRIQVTPQPWFYLELLLLAIPSAVFVNGLLDRVKFKGGGEPGA
ncbi:hypothetical protein [Luteolibacter soli]|uniref:Uncharacterized protein n=1 Tax=Luteolibacter soli TaxID=3135280 RepID=A0ABU9B4W7_9BACT